MMTFSLKQSPFGLTVRLLARPRLPPSLPLIFISAAAIDRRPCLHLSSSTTAGFLSHVNKKSPRRHFQCSAAAGAAEEGSNNLQKTLDFFFYNRPATGFVDSLTSAALAGACYASIVVFVKWTLDAFPYPWLVSTVYLAAGFLHLLYSCLIGGFNPLQETDLQFWKSLFPVALAHTIGLVAQTMSLSLSSIAFTHILRCAEPLFSMLLRSFFKREDTYSMPHYLSLFPIVAGVALTSLTESNCSRTSFIAAMIANMAFATRSILTEKMEEENKAKIPMNGQHFFASLSALSLLILAPFTLAMEGPQVWVAGWETVVLQKSPHFLTMMVLCHGISYCLYNEGLYDIAFPRFCRFNFFTINTLKKFFVVYFSSVVLNTPLQPISVLGASLAILGIFLYSRELCKIYKQRTWLL